MTLSIDQPTVNNILSTLEKSDDNFVAVFLSNLPKIFCYDRRTIVTHLEDKHSEESLFELQNKLHIQLLEKFPQYVGSKVIKRKRKDLLAGDVYQFGYSIDNLLETTELRSCLKTSHDRSLLSQSSSPQDDDTAAVSATALQIADLLEMCAALKTSLGAAVDRIAKLEKRDQENGRELTSLKLKLQPRPDNEASSAYSFVDWPKLPAVTQLGTATVGAATPASHQEHRVATDSPITACVHELSAARSDANNAIVPPAVTTRARHLSDTNDEYYTAATASPSADFTLPAECRRRLTRPERQTRTTRSASPISGNTPLPTSNRLSVLSDDYYQSTEVTLKVVRSANSLHKVYVGKFDPETSEADMRSYVKRHVVQDETDIAYVKKLRSQSHSAASSCSFCVVVGSSATRKALFEKSRWPRDVTVRVFKPTIPKGSGSRRDRGQHRDGNRTRDGNRRRHGNVRHVTDVRHGDKHAHDTRNGDRVQRLYDEGRPTGSWRRSYSSRHY